MLGSGPSQGKLQNSVAGLIVAVSIVAGYQAVRPPALPADPAATEFSAKRAIDHLAVIADSPHPMGSPANAAVRQYLLVTLNDLGIETQVQALKAPDYYAGSSLVDVVNVIARIPGTNSTGAIALVAHYDTVPWTSGANDNSAAVAALLETARALTSGPALTNDILLIFTDGEEPGPRPGSTAFVTQSPVVAGIAIVVNFEASGGSGASLLVEVNGPESWLIGELSRIDSHPAAFSALTTTSRLLGDIGTDFDQFRNAGISGLHFAYIHGSSIYHTNRDDFAAVDLGSLQHHGDHALGIARHFGLLDLRSLPGDQAAVYFPVRPFYVRYSTAFAMVLLVLAGLGLGSGLRRRRGWWQSAGSSGGAGKGTLLYLGSIVAGTIAWMLIAGGRPTLGLGEGYFYFGGLIVAMGAATSLTRRWTSPRSGLGSVLLWLVLSGVTTLVAVGFSYVFIWPTLAATTALWWRADGFVQQSLRFGMVALITLVVTVPVVDILLQFASPRPGNPDSNVPAAVLLPLALALMIVALLRRFWPVVSPSAAPAPPPE